MNHALAVQTPAAAYPALPAQLQPQPLSRVQLEQLAAAIIRHGDSPHTRRNYATDLARFHRWLSSEGLAPHAATPDDLDRYRAWLIEPDEDGEPRYSVSSANRSLVVVRLFYMEAQRRGLVWVNPASWLRSIKGTAEGHPAMTLGQVRELLRVTDAECASEAPHVRLSALRDRVALHLLIRNGLRRSELSGVRVKDFGEDRGHPVLTVRVGKGRKVRQAKMQADSMRAIRAWLDAAELTPADPLLVAVAKGGRVQRQPISGEAIREIVRRRLRLIGVEDPRFGAHAMRATFVTLALEGGAPVQKVQRAAGHASADTTGRYDRHRTDLDDNASDYIRV